jgi:hypothetical protein
VKSTSPVFFEALNGTQKNLIEGACKYYFESIDTLAIHERVKALKAIMADVISPEDEAYFKSKNVWSDIELMRNILSHPCPHHKNVGDYSAAVADDFFASRGSEDLSLGIKKGKVYYYGEESEVRCEQPGLLGLTGRNDSTAPSVTKNSVVNYMHNLIHLAILENHRLMGITKDENTAIKSFIDNNNAISETHWLVCLAQDKHYLHPVLYIEGVREGVAFLDHYQIKSNPVGSITIGHQLISREPKIYRGEEGVYQLFKINAADGVLLKDSLKSEIKNYISKLNIFFHEMSVSMVDDTASQSIDWIIKKLANINLNVDRSLFLVKKESKCFVM